MRQRWKRTGAALFAAALLLAQGMPAFFRGQSPAVQADAGGPGLEDATPHPESVPGGTKLIALTFDDGPRRSTTTRLLDGLSQRGVRATFFLIGKNVEVNRDLVKRMEREGHQVGIHSYDHQRSLAGLNQADFAAQVERSRDLLSEILGHSNFALRPPYGQSDAGVQKWAGGPIILWSIDPEDWGDQNVDREVKRITQNAKDGDIILMHDIFDATVEAALQVVDRLHAEGFYFVTVDELFDQKHLPLEEGEIYRRAEN